MPNNSATPPLSQQWRKQIEDWRNSGLSQQAFCRNRGLSYHKFHYWRKKLTGELVNKPVNKTPSRSSALVPVTYQSPSPTDSLSVHLPNGVCLRGISGDNLLLVERLLESLS
jgi:hypothetical protein